MYFLDLTLSTAEENLALEDALLEQAERGEAPGEVLRIWEPASPLVVVGRSSRPEREVDIEGCRAAGVPILRRASGGAAIVTGPGCLMYAVLLAYEHRPLLRALDEAHAFVLGRLVDALSAHLPDVDRQGTSDLTIGPMKFSGNSLRCRRDHFLYHGTLLYDFPLELVERCLTMPPRQPEYRAGRSHATFVANLPLPREVVRATVIEAWGAATPYADVPLELTRELAATKYGQHAWTWGDEA